MSNSSEDSGSESDMSEGARAARDRIMPKTQKDYASYIKQIIKFAVHPDRKASFADCFSGTEVIMPVKLKLGKAFMCHLRDKLVSWPMDPRPEAECTSLRHYSTSHINNAIQAIKQSFHKLSAPIPDSDNKFYNDFSRAYSNLIAQEKGRGAYPAVEGTVALCLSHIIKVIEAAFKYVPQGKGRAESAMHRLWLFILMALATMARGERVSRIQFQCIKQFCDSLTIQVPTSKSDILGLMSYAKMCFANTRNPMCCLATALGVEFLSREPNSNFQYLFGERGESSGYIVKQMQAALKTIIIELGAATLGTTQDRLTTHFLKKTAMGILRSQAEIVDRESRELRADHRVGPYNQRSDQDAVVGRVLAFLTPGTSDFMLSPPHFHPQIVGTIPWNAIVPGFDQYTIETQRAVHLSVASVIANADFLKKKLSRSHPLHGCALFTTCSKWIGILQPHVLGGTGCFKSVLDATGKSIISNLAHDVAMLRKQQLASGPGIGAASHDTEQVIQEMMLLRKELELHRGIQQNVPDTRPGMGWAPLMPRLWVSQLGGDFRFPVGVKMPDAWRRWHCGDHPLRVLTSKTIPPCDDSAERNRQLVLRNKFKGTFQIIQGQTPDRLVDKDPEYVWGVCWKRCVQLFNIPEKSSWVVSTCYDFFMKFPEKVKSARAAASISDFDVAVVAAARATRDAEVAQAFAVACAATPVQRIAAEPSQSMHVAEDLIIFSDAAAAAVVQSIAEATVALGGAGLPLAAVEGNEAAAALSPGIARHPPGARFGARLTTSHTLEICRHSTE